MDVKKRMLFVIPNLGGGGAEKVLVNLCNCLNKNKYDVTILTLFKAGVNAQFLDDSVKLIEGNVKQFRGNSHLMKLFSPKFLYRFFIKNEYDCIIAYLEGPAARIVSGCTHPKTKLVSWIHCEQSLKEAVASFRSREEARRCYMRFDKIVCVAETVRTNFMNYFDVSKNSTVIYNVVDSIGLKNKALECINDNPFNDGLKIVSTGRLINLKGYDRLINIHRRLLDNGIKNQVYILGRGELQHYFESDIIRFGIKDTFHLLGFHANPYKYMAHADLFVCSSRKEGISTAVTEALILGLPVVSTNCSGTTELLGEHNEYGIVTENDEESLYHGVITMLSGNNLLYYKNKSIERGKMFSKEKCVLAAEKLFDSLIYE